MPVDAIQQTDAGMEAQISRREPARPREPDDESLAEAAIAGEAGAMEAVMRRYNRRLFRIARSVLASDGEAEEIVQETYLQVFLKRADYRGEGAFGAWIARIALNLALSRRRALARRPEQSSEAPEEDRVPQERWGSPAAPSPERAAALAELRRVIEEEIDSLSDTYRQVFVLRVMEGLSVEETAQLLAIAPGAVKTRLHRANRQLRQALEGHLSAATLQAFPFAGARCDGLVARVLGEVEAQVGAEVRPPP